MRKRFLYISGSLLLVILVGLVVWQVSFSFGSFEPSSPEQTYIFWAVSTLIFVLTVTLGFMLTRNFIKLYVDRSRNREGSRLRTKLVAGALILTITPVVFQVIFSWGVLNRTIDKWFTRPAWSVRGSLIEVGNALRMESEEKAGALAAWVSTLPEARVAREGDVSVRKSLQEFCEKRRLVSARVELADGSFILLCHVSELEGRRTIGRHGDVLVESVMPLDISATQASIAKEIELYDYLHRDKKEKQRFYLLLLTLITLFILFFATWLALYMAKQISTPIAALLEASQEVRKGNLGHRVQVGALDELATLVRAFNEMTQALEANSQELENRRRFTEAILESIPTGVISLGPDGRIQRVNRALRGLLKPDVVDRAQTLRDLFTSEDHAELLYLMKRARRLGVAATQLEYVSDGKVLHLSLTVAALDEKVRSGYVIVLEDTSDLLRAQKAAAWHEIARRIAHEIKNPLTPIALCAERIARQLQKPAPEKTIMQECSSIISSEVESVRALVDEFSQFARFPSAQPVLSDLNEVVENAMAVFAGRLEGIQVIRDLRPGLPQVNIDREQFKRLVVNLVDNAAEAMSDSLVRRLYVGTSEPVFDMVELIVADTGRGISAADKERLFIPYFTTKSRGTGLGLAIVNHIVSEHNARIRVEENAPAGARFIVELPVAAPERKEAPALEVRA
jgi:PAS domain S-box-containing protein